MIDTITETFDELEYLFAEIVKIEITQEKLTQENISLSVLFFLCSRCCVVSPL